MNAPSFNDGHPKGSQISPLWLTFGQRELRPNFSTMRKYAIISAIKSVRWGKIPY